MTSVSWKTRFVLPAFRGLDLNADDFCLVFVVVRGLFLVPVATVAGLASSSRCFESSSLICCSTCGLVCRRLEQDSNRPIDGLAWVVAGGDDLRI